MKTIENINTKEVLTEIDNTAHNYVATGDWKYKDGILTKSEVEVHISPPKNDKVIELDVNKKRVKSPKRAKIVNKRGKININKIKSRKRNTKITK